MQGASACPAASRPSAPCWATSLRESLQRHRHSPTRRLAADDCWYTWEQFAVYYRQDAQPMWEAARQREICNKIWSGVISIRLRYFARRREMAIWSQVVTRLEENLRRSRWRIIARKMRRFTGVCLIHSYLRTREVRGKHAWQGIVGREDARAMIWRSGLARHTWRREVCMAIWSR